MSLVIDSEAVAFAPVRKRNVYEQVAASVRDAIVSGHLRPGDPLPSERELADQFGVNRSSVREALRRLEGWGLIQIRHGSPTVVRNFLVTAGPDLLPFFIAPTGSPDPKILSDLLAMRTMLLTWTAREAALHGPSSNLSHLTRIVEALERGADSPTAMQVLDFDFFLELVALTGNTVLALLSNSIRQVYLSWPDLFTPLYQPGVFDSSPHRRALAAIAAGAPDDAVAAVQAWAEEARLLLDRAAAEHLDRTTAEHSEENTQRLGG